MRNVEKKDISNSLEVEEVAGIKRLEIRVLPRRLVGASCGQWHTYWGKVVHGQTFWGQKAVEDLLGLRGPRVLAEFDAGSGQEDIVELLSEALDCKLEIAAQFVWGHVALEELVCAAQVYDLFTIFLEERVNRSFDILSAL